MIYRAEHDLMRACSGKALMQLELDRTESGITAAEWCKQLM